MAQVIEQSMPSFCGCQLSILLNGLNVLTIDEAVLIKSVLAFIARNENRELETPKKTRGRSKVKVVSLDDARYVKAVVFDEQNRVLTVKRKNRFVLPGGLVEWDDDDAEAAARREVFEAANIAIGILKPVTVIKTKNRQNQTARTIVFVGRLRGEAQASDMTHRFMDKETFFETPGGQGSLVRSLVEAAQRVLVSEEIRNEHNQETDMGRVLVASKR